MNKIWKRVWNRVRGCYVAVNETVSGAAQSSGPIRNAAVCITSALIVGNALAAVTSSGSVSGSYGTLEIGGGSATVTLTAKETPLYTYMRANYNIFGDGDVGEDCTPDYVISGYFQRTYGNRFTFFQNTDGTLRVEVVHAEWVPVGDSGYYRDVRLATINSEFLNFPPI